MKNAPELDSVAEKIREILRRILDRPLALELDTPLMKGHGLDSLDMVELSFALEEYFGFEFSGRNAIEELDKRLGGGLLGEDGTLTPLGRRALLDRMPELESVDLPPALHAAEIPQYFTIRTYARLIKEFYDRAPDACPETGEPVVLDEFDLVTERSRRPVGAPPGDVILDAWLDGMVHELAR